MIPFVKDEFHFTRQMAVFFVIFKDDVPEIYLYPDRTARFDVLYFSTLKGTAEEFNVRECRKVSRADRLLVRLRNCDSPAP